MNVQDRHAAQQAPASRQAGQEPREVAASLRVGRDRLSLSRDGAQPMTREEWARRFRQGFNRGADRDSTLAAGGFFAGAIGSAMLAYGLTTAGVSLAVPVVGGVLAVAGIAAFGIGLYRKLRQRS